MSFGTATKYAPNQPRVPAGNTNGGQWTRLAAVGERLAYVIRVCIISGISRTTDAVNGRTWTATYDCAGGRSFVRSGIGHNAPGLVRDPFQ